MMKSGSYKKVFLSVLVILIIIFLYLYFRALPKINPILQTPASPKTQFVKLPWPSAGQSALGAEGYGVLDSHNATTAVPVGSTAKIITVLAVLKQKPITAGSQGPAITLNDSDVALYDSYYSQGGSVTKVGSGEQITELQALQSMLLPSSNNMADSLAKWAFGSVNSYLAYANRMVKSLGMNHTTVGDTNGFSDKTTTTADDMVKLGLAAMNDPAIVKVAGQTSATLPVAGQVNNINVLLGQDGIYGIKTGFTNKAGGCYLFAARHNISGHMISYVGAILNQPTLGDALNASLPVLRSADSSFVNAKVISVGEKVALYKAPWGSSSTATSSKDISVLRWKGQEIRISTQLDSIPSAAKAGYSPGKVVVINGRQSASADVVLAQNLAGPPIGWRLFR